MEYQVINKLSSVQTLLSIFPAVSSSVVYEKFNSMVVYTLRVVIPAFSVTHISNYSSAYSFSGGRRRRIVTTKSCLNVSTVDISQAKLIEKIRKRITNEKVEISPSAYDTAWVAMVPSSREYSGGGITDQPCFPQCLDWIMENQNPNGSWGSDPGHPSLMKDALSCTLACVLALRKWDAGHQLVQTGMDFIASNAWATSQKDQFSPVGFEIIFPWMVNYAKDLDLTLPLSLTSHVDSLLHIQDSGSTRRKQNQVYAAEGLGKSCNWNEIISKHQRSNGSLFDSPATTAASLLHCHDDKCFEYLVSILENNCNGWVPTVYPMDIYTRLCVVDSVERLGVNKYFESELRSILDEIHRCWMAKEDEIFSDITCHALAFQLLRTHGYDDVASDELAEYVDEQHFFKTVSIQYHDVTTVLELYRASQVRICDEGILDKIHAWTSAFLKQQLLNQSILDKRLHKQVNYDLKNFHGTLDQFGVRRSIELYDAQDFRILKTTYRCPTIHNEDFIRLSIQDYGISQAQYQKELQQMERWYAESRLDRLNQGRNVLQVSYSLIAAVINNPELYVARISYVKAIVLITLFDDFFDRYGSKEEALCVIELVKKWNVLPETTYCSQEVEILFTVLYNTVNEVAAKAYSEQGYCVKNDLVSRWLELLENFSRENESWSNETNVAMSLGEYLSFAWKSIGGRICVFTPTPFLGMKIPQDVFKSAEFTSLSEHTGLVCRLLNDLKTFKKERDEGTLNSVSVQTVRGISEEEAILKVEEIIEYNRRQLMRMVYRTKGSIVPRECKQLFFKTCKMAYCVYPYDGGDEYSSPQLIMKDINAMIWEPLST